MRLLARQAGWQDVLTRLYVLEAAAAGSPLPFPSELPASPEPASPKPPTESPDSSDVFLPSEAPCPDPDAFYQALSPFSPPLDLGLERSSVDSGNIAGGGNGSSGTLTPASQPGTPSPLDGPRPFPAAQGRHSSSLSNVLGDGSLPEPTTGGDDTSNTSNPQVRRAPSATVRHSGGHLSARGRQVALPNIGAAAAEGSQHRAGLYSVRGQPLGSCLVLLGLECGLCLVYGTFPKRSSAALFFYF